MTEAVFAEAVRSQDVSYCHSTELKPKPSLISCVTRGELEGTIAQTLEPD